MGTIGGRLDVAAGWVAYTTNLVGLRPDGEHSHGAVTEHTHEQGIAPRGHRASFVASRQHVRHVESPPVLVESPRVTRNQGLEHPVARLDALERVDVRVRKEM